MSHFHLMKPSIEQKEKYLDYINEWINEKIVPFAARLEKKDYLSWLLHLKNEENIETCTKGFVPSSLFLYMKEDEIIGVCHIRHYLNPYLSFVGGHIGYGIRPSQRRKGYAKKMLELALKEAKKMNINPILVTADDDNLASYKTIESCGGMKENEVFDHDHMVFRYLFYND